MSEAKPADMIAWECLMFVQAQSCGEWGEEIERADAQKLERFVREQIAAATLTMPKGDG